MPRPDLSLFQNAVPRKTNGFLDNQKKIDKTLSLLASWIRIIIANFVIWPQAMQS